MLHSKMFSFRKKSTHKTHSVSEMVNEQRMSRPNTIMSSFQSTPVPSFISTLENRRRHGTLNQGISYEVKICALFALRFVDPNNGLKNFWMVQNCDHPVVGNFDDIVIQMERHGKNDSAKLCIQLKHFGTIERQHKLKYSTFHKQNAKKKGPFNLFTYYKSVDNRSQYIKNSSLNDVKYIIFTNKGKDEMEKRFISYSSEDVDLINTGGEAFRFQEFTVTKKTPEENLVTEEIDSKFLQKLIILCGQENEENLHNLIGKTLQNMFNLDDVKTEEIVVKYIGHIGNWLNGDCGGGRSLTKEEITFKLGEFLMNNYIFHLPLTDGLVPQIARNTTDLWNQISRKHKAILVENCKSKKVCESAKSLTANVLLQSFKKCTNVVDWSVKFSMETMQELWFKYRAVDPRQEMLMLWGNEKVKNITLQTLHFYLWKTNVLPLAVQVETEEDLTKLLKVASFTSGRCVIFYSGVVSETIKKLIENLPFFHLLIKGDVEENPAILYNFLNLSNSDKKLILEKQMVLQGRKVILNDVLQNENIMSKLLASHIANMLLMKFDVGEKCAELPEIFIDRTLKSFVVDPEILNDNTREVCIVVCNSYNDFIIYVRRSQMVIAQSDIKLLFNFGKNSNCSQMSHCSGAIAKNSLCQIPTAHEVILINSNDVGNIEAERAKLKNNNVVFSFYRLAKVGQTVEIKPLDATTNAPTVNVIVTTKYCFYSFMKYNSIEFKESHIYELQCLPSKCIPINCKYLLTPSAIDLCSLKKRFDERPIKFYFYKLRSSNFERALRSHVYTLELLGPLDEISYLKKYNVNNETREGVRFSVGNLIYSKLNIISGSPGMGKSVLMNYFSLICPSNFWLIQVNLNENGKYFYNEDLDKRTLDHLKHLTHYSKLGEIEQNLVNDYLFNKRVCVFFDGFDEIDPECEGKLCEFIQQVVNAGFIVFVSTRPVKVPLLELYFNCLSRQIMPFTEKTQLEYIKTFYNSKIRKSEAAVRAFVTELLQSNASHLTAWDKGFAEIPLQTKMISDIYLESCKNFCRNFSNKRNKLKLEQKDLLDVYEKFIELKIEHVQNKENNVTVTSRQHFQQVMHNSLNNHMQCALVAIFGKNDVTSDIDQFILEIEKGKDKIGLIDRISDDGTPVFVHRTFAEYLVGSYLARNFMKENVRTLILKICENPLFYVIRNIFDRLLCRDCQIHLAVLNRDMNKFEKLIKDPSERNNLDWGGRSVLHLAMSWGARHEVPGHRFVQEFDVTHLEDICKSCRDEEDTENYVKTILDNSRVLLFKQDQVFNETPLFYGIKVMAFKNVDLFLESIWNNEKSFIKLSSTLQHLYVYNTKVIQQKTMARFIKKQKMNLKKIKKKIQSVLSAEYSDDDDGVRSSSSSDYDPTLSLIPQEYECVTSKADHLQLMFVSSMYDYSSIALAMIKLNPSFYKIVKMKTGRQRFSLLHVAALTTSHKMVDLLLRERLDVNIRDADMETVLHVLSRTGRHMATVKYMLEKGANVDLVNKNRWSPLLVAARKGYEDIVRLLILARADVNATDSDGWTVLRHVRDQPNIKAILERAGALEHVEKP